MVQGERYLLTGHRYIELSPARASMTDDPSEYRWSSYHRNALGQPDKRIESHVDYLRLGTEPAERQAAYRKLFRAHIDPELKLLLPYTSRNANWDREGRKAASSKRGVFTLTPNSRIHDFIVRAGLLE